MRSRSSVYSTAITPGLAALGPMLSTLTASSVTNFPSLGITSYHTQEIAIAPSEPERDILDQYLYEVSTYPLLKGAEEIELAKKIRAGDGDALQELVKRNLRFVISVAKKYQNRGLPLIDLIGEGNVGLLTAARKFDPDQGVKFISYAVWWIRQAILSSLARQGRTVRVPLNRTADLSRIIKASEILRQKMRREPTPEELSQLQKNFGRLRDRFDLHAASSPAGCSVDDWECVRATSYIYPNTPLPPAQAAHAEEHGPTRRLGDKRNTRSRAA